MLIGSLNYENLAAMRQMFLSSSCSKDDLDFETVYSYFRGSFLATVYWSIAGMILATFYFLFKRTNIDEYRQWHRKAKWLVISLFFSTAFAICSIILLTNLFFYYYLLTSHDNICDNGSAIYTTPGIVLGVTAFIWSLFLIM